MVHIYYHAPMYSIFNDGIDALPRILPTCQQFDCLNRRKSINKSGPGFGYGFIVAFCFTLAFFCLLCGLVLDGFQDVVKNQLESCESLQEADAQLAVMPQRMI